MAERKMGKRSTKAKEALRKRRQRRAAALGLVKDVVVAFVIVIIVMASLYAFSGGIWPPMVVVESESMMHGDDSQIGVIDTGDLTIVKKIDDRHDIVTYVEGSPSVQLTYRRDKWDGTSESEDITVSGKRATHKSYSDYGDVIIYKKNGMEGTPVIHRTIIWIQPNVTNECLDQLPHNYVAGGDFPDIGLRCVTHVTLHKVGYKSDDVQINVNTIMNNAVAVDGEPFAGFLTKGDHNRNPSGPSVTDQESHHDEAGKRLAPIKVAWVVGKSVGELPWFGSLKLVLSKTREAKDIPPSSWRGLIITIVLILVIPFIFDMVVGYYEKKKKKGKDRDDVEGDDDEEAEEKGGGRGRGKARGGRKRKERRPRPDGDEEEGEDEQEVLEEVEEEDFNDDFEADFEDMAGPSIKKKG